MWRFYGKFADEGDNQVNNQCMQRETTNQYRVKQPINVERNNQCM
jgi:hypothetical protein